VNTGKKGKPHIGLKVVLDTNVYISVFNFPESPLWEIWRHARNGTYNLIISPAIIKEFARICRENFSWGENKIVHHLKLITTYAEIVVPQFVPDVIKEDPDDNHILACALAGKANLIVSRDLDLLRLKKYEEIGFMSPIDFLHTLEGFTKAA
jgi:putative PIN family toxin of toxin-antitoxin system